MKTTTLNKLNEGDQFIIAHTDRSKRKFGRMTKAGYGKGMWWCPFLAETDSWSKGVNLKGSTVVIIVKRLK